MAEIKEMKELIAGVKMVGLAAKAVMKDGKIGADDLAVIVPFLAKAEVLVQAIQGLNLIKDEAKDLSMAEAQELIAELFMLVKEIKEA